MANPILTYQELFAQVLRALNALDSYTVPTSVDDEWPDLSVADAILDAESLVVQDILHTLGHGKRTGGFITSQTFTAANMLAGAVQTNPRIGPVQNVEIELTGAGGYVSGTPASIELVRRFLRTDAVATFNPLGLTLINGLFAFDAGQQMFYFTGASAKIYYASYTRTVSPTAASGSPWTTWLATVIQVPDECAPIVINKALATLLPHEGALLEAGQYYHAQADQGRQMIRADAEQLATFALYQKAGA